MQPIMRKRMVICTPFGKFVNGPQKGAMTVKRLQEIAENFKKYPRQVKAYLNGDHPETRSARPADGWYENVEFTYDYPGYPEGALVGDCKAHGELALWIEGDLVRGASIATVDGKNPDGTPQGEILDHVLISDDAFDKRVNIAAAHAQGGEPIAYHFTALKKEAAMADEKDQEITALKDKVKTLEASTPDAALKAKEQEIIDAKAETLRLKEQVETLQGQLANASVDKDKEALAIENVNLKHRCFAQDVRAIVNFGLRGGTLKAAWCDGFAGKGPVDYDGTIRWLKASRFYDKTSPNPEDFAFRALRLQAESGDPLYRVGQSFRTAAAASQGEVTLSQEERERMNRSGIDPDKVIAGMKAKEGGREAYLAAVESK